MKKGKYLITGSAGFIGSNLAKNLYKKYELILVDDLSEGSVINLPHVLRKKLIHFKYNLGFKIGCFTASAKGNTLLNCLNLNKKIIQFASENNPKKIGKYTPGTHIKIISDKDFCNKKIDYAILLSWNYKKFFLSKSLFIKKGGKFIVPLPIPHIK